MTARKSHPKSRNGCAQCKRRRIKCDEVKPNCTNCVKHEIECDFATNPPAPVRNKSPASAPSPPKRKKSAADDDTTRPKRRELGPESREYLSQQSHGNPDGPGQSVRPLQMEELELLHHFTVETCQTLSDRETSHKLWRVTVPKIAFEHDFLMRGILAISALHLSYLRPAQQDHYFRIAMQQQDAALSSFQNIMKNMQDDHCDAFFAMSNLVVVYGFESPKASNSLGMFNYNSDQTDEWLPLIRGVDSVLRSQWLSVKRGRLNGLLHEYVPSTLKDGVGEASVMHALPSPLEGNLHRLEQNCEELVRSSHFRTASASKSSNTTATTPAAYTPSTTTSTQQQQRQQQQQQQHDDARSPPVVDPQHEQDEDTHACQEALYQLRVCFARVVNKRTDECEVSLAFLWAVTTPQRYLDLLNAHHPVALVILAYYCVILHHLDHYWWLMGWGQHIIQNIQRELSDDMLAWIDWPRRTMHTIRHHTAQSSTTPSSSSSSSSSMTSPGHQDYAQGNGLRSLGGPIADPDN